MLETVDPATFIDFAIRPPILSHAVHLVFHELAIVDLSIFVPVDSTAFLHVILPLSFVSIAIFPDHFSLAFDPAVHPLAEVVTTIMESVLVRPIREAAGLNVVVLQLLASQAAIYW